MFGCLAPIGIGASPRPDGDLIMVIDPRFIKNVGREVFTGNELLVKGALETEGGVHLLTGYPGSPIASFFDTLGSLAPLLDEHGMVAQFSGRCRVRSVRGFHTLLNLDGSPGPWQELRGQAARDRFLV